MPKFAKSSASQTTLFQEEIYFRKYKVKSTEFRSTFKTTRYGFWVDQIGLFFFSIYDHLNNATVVAFVFIFIVANKGK